MQCVSSLVHEFISALRLDNRDKKQVVSSHEGTKGTKVFWGQCTPRQTNALINYLDRRSVRQQHAQFFDVRVPETHTSSIRDTAKR